MLKVNYAPHEFISKVREVGEIYCRFTEWRGTKSEEKQNEHWLGPAWNGWFFCQGSAHALCKDFDAVCKNSRGSRESNITVLAELIYHINALARIVTGLRETARARARTYVLLAPNLFGAHVQEIVLVGPLPIGFSREVIILGTLQSVSSHWLLFLLVYNIIFIDYYSIQHLAQCIVER